MRIILLSPGLFWDPLFWLNSSFKLVFALNDCDYPVSLRNSWASFGRLLLERISYHTRRRTVRWSLRSGEVGGWFGATPLIPFSESLKAETLIIDRV